MKSNKELVLTYVQKQSSTGGVTTSEVAKQTGLQRSNASALLNQLVEENILTKSKGRPVLYALAEQSMLASETSCFSNLIGFDRSLKSAVQLAKAAALYPQGCLNVVLIGEPGVGISYFVYLMHLFAIENDVFSEKQPLVKFNCKHYADEPNEMLREMFGPKDKQFQNIFQKSASGILFLDHIEYLPAKGRNILGQILEEGCYEVLGTGEIEQVRQPVILACTPLKDNPSLESIVAKTAVRIELANLSSRGLQERFELINHFFSLESLQVDKQLTINSELLICLLLYTTEKNVRQLRDDIHIGCANAYVGAHTHGQAEIKVYLSHFRPHVRKGFLRYREHREQLKHLIPTDYSYSYKGYDISRNPGIEYELAKPDLYGYIDQKITELEYDGMAEYEIGTYIGTELESFFSKYTKEIKQKDFDTVQLEKVVSKELIALVDEFLKVAETEIDRTFDPAIFYGLCLHVNGISLRKGPTTVLNQGQIKEIAEQNKQEYALAMQLVVQLEHLLETRLPMSEAAIITLFLLQKPTVLARAVKPIVIVAMHGDETAQSIVKVVKELSQATNIYAFDMKLSQKVEDAYQDLKQLVHELQPTNGLILLYDMGSFKTMAEMLRSDLNIEVRLINVPITLFALDIARKTLVHDDLDLIYNQSVKELQRLIQSENSERHYLTKPKIVLTLCTTGEGGAVQLKNYLENSPVGKKYRIINSSMTDKRTIQAIQAEMEIVAVVGTFDPNIGGIPFVSIKTIFATDPNELLPIIEGSTKQKLSTLRLAPVYHYLDEQLHFVAMDKLKQVLPLVLTELDQLSKQSLTEDQLLGLFVHIACTLERLLANEPSPHCLSKEMILVKYPDEFNQVLKIVKRLERKFGVIFNDDEIATILMIIKQI